MSKDIKTFQQNIVLRNIERWLDLHNRGGLKRMEATIFNALYLRMDKYPNLPEELKPSVFFAECKDICFDERVSGVFVEEWMMLIHDFIDKTTKRQLMRG